MSGLVDATEKKIQEKRIRQVLESDENARRFALLALREGSVEDAAAAFRFNVKIFLNVWVNDGELRSRIIDFMDEEFERYRREMEPILKAAAMKSAIEAVREGDGKLAVKVLEAAMKQGGKEIDDEFDELMESFSEMKELDKVPHLKIV